MLDEKTFSFIRKGLYEDPLNYELYLLLGNKLEDQNPYLSYLLYENAEYCCRTAERVPGDLREIRAYRDSFFREKGISVPPVSIIILSQNMHQQIKRCIDSIRRTVNPESYELIIVDLASTDGSREWLEEQTDLKLIADEVNAGYSSCCNQAIQAATEGNDIFLMKPDTVLFMNSLFYLRMGLYEDSNNGTAGSVSNVDENFQKATDFPTEVSDLESYVRDKNLVTEFSLEQRTFLAGFALLLRRESLRKTGFFDERFYTDDLACNDMGIRMLEAGFQNVCCWNSLVFRTGNDTLLEVKKKEEDQAGQKSVFENKWGFFPVYYSGIREDLLEIIPGYKDEMRILEVGCGFGETLGRIRYLSPGVKVYGIEITEKVAEIANKKFPVMCDNIETMDLPFDERSFDYVIFADVLEHLVSPYAVLNKIYPYVKNDGHVLASIPNLMNATVIYQLLHGYFTYEDSGILDRTHLRFFTCKEILKMFSECGYEVENISGKAVNTEMTVAYQDFFDKLLQIEGVEDRKYFDTFQYFVSARKKSEDYQG